MFPSSITVIVLMRLVVGCRLVVELVDLKSASDCKNLIGLSAKYKMIMKFSQSILDENKKEKKYNKGKNAGKVQKLFLLSKTYPKDDLNLFFAMKKSRWKIVCKICA